MISSLNGALIEKNMSYAVLECGGVGFQCFITMNTYSKLPSENSNIQLYTYLSVKEDSLDLYGFIDKAEMECFKLLINVSGVGAKIAIAMLSQFEPEQVYMSIASDDSKSLTRAAGVGAKLAQRIVLELRDKVSKIDFGKENTSQNVNNIIGNSDKFNTGEAIEALVALGFNKTDAAMAVAKFDPDLSTEALIKSALKILSGR